MRGSDQSGHLVTFTSLLTHGVNFLLFFFPPICSIAVLLAAELTEVSQYVTNTAKQFCASLLKGGEE